MNKQGKKDVIKILTILGLVFYLGAIISGITQGEEVVVIEAKEPPKEIVTPVPTSIPEDPSIKDLIFKVFGKEDGKTAYAIAKCESGKRDENGTFRIYPDLVHSDNIEHSVGVFQIHIAKDHGKGPKVHWDKIPGETLEEKTEWLKIPENNILIAKFIFGSSKWYPWSCFTKGGYKKYL